MEAPSGLKGTPLQVLMEGSCRPDQFLDACVVFVVDEVPIPYGQNDHLFFAYRIEDSVFTGPDLP